MKPDRTPLPDWLAKHDGRVALVFTDVVGSTLLLHRLETVNFLRMLRAHRTRAEQLIAEQGGRVVDESGDEVFAIFPRVSQAYAFASGLFRDPGHPRLRIRGGIHYGTVRTDGGALVGRNVHLAARVMQHGDDEELWVSDAAKTALEAEGPDAGRPITWVASERCVLKGIPREHTLWRAD